MQEFNITYIEVCSKKHDRQG